MRVHTLFRRGLGVKIAAAVFATAAAIGFTAAPASAAPFMPATDSDPFYAEPAGIENAANGDVLRVQALPSPFPGSSAQKVLFRSTNSQGEPIAAVTTVIVPDGGARHDLLSYQPFTNSLGPQCAPSHQIFRGGLQEQQLIGVALARGVAVNIPDHLGPTSAYGAARLGGTITLDSVRAVQSSPGFRVGDSRTVLAGYSGGAMATAFAGVLAPTYAPELDLVGLSAGGTPVNLEAIARTLGVAPNPLFGLGFAASLGLEREYPNEVSLSEQLNGRGVALANQIRNACTDPIIDAGANMKIADVVDSGTLANTQAGVDALNRNSVQMFPGAPRMPVLLYQGADDQLTPTSRVLATAAHWCRQGTRVQTVIVPGDHGSTIAAGVPIALSYLNDRLAGAPAPSTC
ncbi:lipase family protein [Williamsia muralis]|uniref:lipase family protein n=1 Tax=Williamsia marianensis TaxID=85044 RepID=UPI003F18594A